MQRPRTIRVLELLRKEDGLTLVELMVATVVLSVVLVIFFSTLVSIQSAVSRQDTSSQNNDQARAAIEELDREIRSGNVLYDPATESPANYVLRVYTQSNPGLRFTGVNAVCELWQITSGNELQQRVWPPLNPSAATPWHTVATGVVNRVVSPAVPAFSLDTDPLKGNRTLDITLIVNQDYTNHPSQNVRILASVTGRNTSYGYPVSVCSVTPP